MTEPPVHIRRADDSGATYCGQRGESISLAFWFDHVVANRDGCCKGIWRRLCDTCDHRLPFPPKGTLRGG